MIALGLGAGALLLLLGRKSEASIMHKHGKPKKLSANFDLTEFLRSKAFPSVSRYKLTDQELANLQKLVTKVLQPARNKFGPITITSGVRPKHLKDAQGKTFNERLRERGYNPAEDSDHAYAAAAGTALLADPDQLPELARFYMGIPEVRQVILYYEKMRPKHVHVAVKHPKHPKRARRFAFVIKDGKPLGDLT